MSALINLLTSAFGGSLVGGIASAFQKWQDNRNELKLKELEYKHEKDMSSHERAMAELQLTSQQTIAETEASAARFTADMSALEKSLEMDQATYSTVDTSKANKWLVFVDVLRGMMRPTLTAGLATYCVFVTAYNLIQYGAEFPSERLMEITFVLIDSMATFTGVAISWWFGSRGHNLRKSN